MSEHAPQFDGRAEARRRAALLRGDASHGEWVRQVRSQLDKGGYVSASERTPADDQSEAESSGR